MAAYSTKDARLIVGAYDVSAYVDSVNVKMNAVVDPFHPLGATFPTTYDTGLRNGELTVSGLYDGVISQFLIAGAETNITSLEVEGGTAGTRAYCFPAPQVSAHEVGLSADQMHRLTPEYAISGKVHNAFVVAPLALRTTASNLDSADTDGLAPSTGATAFLHVTALDLDGYDNVVITPRDSDDAITWADCSSSFAAVSAGANLYQALTLTGTVDQYLSVSWAYTGSGTSPTVGFSVYIARD